MNQFKKLLESAKSQEEREGLLKMISMMLCLRKHKRINKLIQKIKEIE